jgi:ureidoglycolate lyase
VLAAGLGQARSANQGTATRWDHVVPLQDLRAGSAKLNVSVFRSAPPAALRLDRASFPVALLEKHPLSTQLFVPLAPKRILVIVARGDERPDLSTLAAFVANGQGISYAPGVWHHPLVALDEELDLACFVHEDGGPGDCVEHALDDERPRVVGFD